ncbi:MAG: phosphatase domain-containing protein [Caldilinea sp.]
MSAPSITVVPYRTFGTAEQLFVKGRVVRDRMLPPAGAEDTRWKNFYHMARRLYSQEVAGARVEIVVGDQRWQAVADEEGYFTLSLPLERPVDPANIWHTVWVQLVEPVARNAPVRVAAEVLTPPPSARFAVISDIDDTILQSHAASLLRSFMETFFRNAQTRLPFAGVATLYQALWKGMSSVEMNPIFYVSSSPWNFYDFLVEFMDRHRLPAGPMFLHDYGLARIFSTLSHRHKLKPIRWLLETYPTLPFVLIGDSGQKDPELYSEIVQAYPGRITAIFIRDVSNQRRDVTVDSLGVEALAQGVLMLRVADSAAAAETAARLGLIPAEAAEAVRRAAAEEEIGI